MSASVRTPADDRNIELGSVISWPPIVAAAGLALVVLIAVVVLGLAAPAAPKTESVATQQTIVPALVDPRPLVERRWRLEVTERTRFDGTIEAPLETSELNDLAALIRADCSALSSAAARCAEKFRFASAPPMSSV